jgi:heme-degrading monooxygenase HmoA
MVAYSIWESYFPPDAVQEGQEVTAEIWVDMKDYDGYLSHDILHDLDDPGHLLVVSRWSSRQRADEVLRDYADNPKAHRANQLVSEPRRRFVARQLSGSSAPLR